MGRRQDSRCLKELRYYYFSARREGILSDNDKKKGQCDCFLKSALSRCFCLHNTFLGHSSRLHNVNIELKDCDLSSSCIQNSNKLFHCHMNVAQVMYKEDVFRDF